jgi:GxxExxY protein
MNLENVIYPDESYRIIGACFEVYNEKGCGFLESVCHECLGLEFGLQRIPFRSQVDLPLSYKGQSLNQNYRADFECFEKIIVEVKALSALADEHTAQVLNYLNATGYELGLLVNFGRYPKLESKRIARSR